MLTLDYMERWGIVCGIFKFRNEPIYIESTSISSKERERERKNFRFSNSQVFSSVVDLSAIDRYRKGEGEDIDGEKNEL